MKQTILHLIKVTTAKNYNIFCLIRFKPRCVQKEEKVKGRKDAKACGARAMLLQPVRPLQRMSRPESFTRPSFVLHHCVHIAVLVASRVGQGEKLVEKQEAILTLSPPAPRHWIPSIETSTWYFLPCKDRGLYFVPLHLTKKYGFPFLCLLYHVRLTCSVSLVLRREMCYKNNNFKYKIRFLIVDSPLLYLLTFIAFPPSQMLSVNLHSD